MSIEEKNKEVVRRWNEEVINGRNAALIDEVLAEDYTNHRSGLNRDGVKQAFDDLFNKQASTFKVRIEDMVAEGDQVAMRSTWHEEGQAPKLALAFYRLVKSKIVDDWYCSE